MSQLDCLMIRFRLDGTGLVYDAREPIHLDALLSWEIAPYHATQRHIGRDDRIEEIKLPLYRHHFVGGLWCWCASALFPVGPSGETIRFWRKRFRQNRIELTRGSPNLTNGIYRDWNNPMPLLLTHEMVAYARGNRREVLKIIRRVPYLGKKRAHGLGKVVSVEVDRIDDDRSMILDGRTMRWMPDENGTRLVRLRPPYWNNSDRVRCAEIGAPIDTVVLDNGNIHVSVA